MIFLITFQDPSAPAPNPRRRQIRGNGNSGLQIMSESVCRRRDPNARVPRAKVRSRFFGGCEAISGRGSVCKSFLKA